MLKRVVLGFLEVMDRGHVSKRICLYVSLWLSVHSALWCLEFAESLLTADADVVLQGSAIIASVMVPINGMTAALLKFYNEGKYAAPRDGAKED